jgi:hypothetical protein
MRLSLTILITGLFAMLTANAQVVRLLNIAQSDQTNRTIYVGIENKLLMQPAIDTSRIRVAEAEWRVNGDTLVVRPTRTGIILCTLQTETGNTEVRLTSRMLPQIRLILEGHFATKIIKGRYEPSQRLILESDNDPEGYLRNMRVMSFLAVINNDSYINNGNTINPELRERIRRAPNKSMLSISRVLYRNILTGATYTIANTHRYTIN